MPVEVSGTLPRIAQPRERAKAREERKAARARVALKTAYAGPVGETTSHEIAPKAKEKEKGARVK